MANYRATVSGNWNTASTWAGGAVPPNGAGHNIYSNNCTVTIDTNVDVALITNAAITASFVGGGTSAVVGGGFVAANGVTITSNIGHGSTAATLTVSGSNSASVVGNVAASSVTTGANAVAISMNTSGSLTITGNVTGGGVGNGWGNHGVNAISGTLNVIGNVNGPNGGNGSGGPAYGIYSTTAPVINITGNVTGNSSNPSGNIGLENRAAFLSGAAILSIVGNATAGSLTNTNAVFSSNANAQVSIIGDITAANGVNAVVAAGNANVVFSGNLTSSVDGTQPIYSTRYRVTPAPLNARTRFASNGIGSYVDMFTADNNLGQANPTDVRSGVSYASGALTGRLTVPARGSVSLSVNYGPSMPFTATRSGTTATATLVYSYPLVVGDQITVTGASNSEWNSTYTIASVVSGASVTFTVPASHSATAGTGANMQTTGTAVLDPAAVASAVWGAATRTLTAGAGISASDVWSYATRTITGGLVDTATTLTNAPTVPSVVQIRQEMDSNSTKLANLDATISSRLAGSAYTAPTTPPTAAEIATAVEGSLLNEADGQAVLNAIVGAIGNTNVSEVSLVAAIRSDIERTGGKLDNVPTAAANASAVWGTATKQITGGTVDTLTNSPSVPSAASIASATRTELAVELARVDAAVSSRMAASEATKLDAVKVKTDALPIERLQNCATTAIVGNLIAQANS